MRVYQLASLAVLFVRGFFGKAWFSLSTCCDDWFLWTMFNNVESQNWTNGAPPLTLVTSQRFTKRIDMRASTIATGFTTGSKAQSVERRRLAWLMLCSLMLLLCLLTADASADTPALRNPGETASFEYATDGATLCRRGTRESLLDITCSLLGGKTAARPLQREVETRASVVQGVQDVGIPQYSEASISNDFEISTDGSGFNQLVDVTISVKYSFFGNFVAAGLYTLENSLGIRIQDRTTNTFVATHTLESMQRQGDQGFTDIALAEERAVKPEEYAQFTVKLRRGGLYRIHFQLQSYAVSFIVGNMRADAWADWEFLKVSIDEDEVELLVNHDANINARLDDIEETLESQGEQLDEIERLVREVQRLILTPQGKRNSDGLKWPNKD